MAASVESISNLERRLTVKVPLAPLEGQITQRLNQISRTAKFARLVVCRASHDV